MTPDTTVAATAGPAFAATLLEFHTGWAWFVIIGNGLAGLWALAANWLPIAADQGAVVVHGPGRADDLRPGGPRRRPGVGQGFVAPKFHMFYGFVAIIAVAIIYSYRAQMRHRLYLLYGVGGLFLMGLGIRAMLVGQT